MSLQESNVWTSSSYHAHAKDSPFLMFADNPWPLRPVVGAVNLLVAVSAGTAGVAMLPVDGGVLFGRSVDGVLSSLAELGFVGLRKGTNLFAYRALLEPSSS